MLMLQSSAASSGGMAQVESCSLQYHLYNNTTQWQSFTERTRRCWTPASKNGHIHIVPKVIAIYVIIASIYVIILII